MLSAISYSYPLVILFTFPLLLLAISSLYSLAILIGRVVKQLASLAPPVSTKRVGGLQFVKIGRFCLSYCVSRSASPLTA